MLSGVASPVRSKTQLFGQPEYPRETPEINTNVTLETDQEGGPETPGQKGNGKR